MSADTTVRSGPRTELVVAVAVAGAAAAVLPIGSGWTTPAFALFGAVLGAVSVYDVAQRRIPNRILYPGGGVATGLLVLAWVADGGPLGVAVVCSIVAFGVTLAVAALAPAGIGMGDVKLLALVGLFVGWIGPDILWWTVVIALLANTAVGVAVRLRGGPVSTPLAPFVAVSALAVAFFGCGAGTCG